MGGMPGQPATPATEEIPTKPPVAATPGVALEGAPVDGGLPAENAELDAPAAAPSGPGTVDMVLSIVAALVSIALLVLVVLKVNGLVNP